MRRPVPFRLFPREARGVCGGAAVFLGGIRKICGGIYGFCRRFFGFPAVSAVFGGLMRRE